MKNFLKTFYKYPSPHFIVVVVVVVRPSGAGARCTVLLLLLTLRVLTSRVMTERCNDGKACSIYIFYILPKSQRAIIRFTVILYGLRSEKPSISQTADWLIENRPKHNFTLGIDILSDCIILIIQKIWFFIKPKLCRGNYLTHFSKFKRYTLKCQKHQLNHPKTSQQIRHQ